MQQNFLKIIYKMINLWNVLNSIKFHELKCLLWNILSMKWSINGLSMKCSVHKMSYLWNVFIWNDYYDMSSSYMKCSMYENLMSMKCPIYSMTFFEMSCLWNVFLWNVPIPKTLTISLSSTLQTFFDSIHCWHFCCYYFYWQY